MTRYCVVIHGLLRTPVSMLYARRALRQAGYKVLLFGYRSRKFEILEQAQILKNFLIKHKADKAELYFLTHSLGSIVTRQFAAQFHKEFNLRRAVMLGPPNAGSQTARQVSKLPPLKFFLGPALKELCDLKVPNASDRLEIGVIAGGTKSGKGYSRLIDGNNDGIVSVAETMLPGAKDHIVLPALHSIMMYYRSVLKQAIYFFEHGVFDRSSSKLFFD